MEQQHDMPEEQQAESAHANPRDIPSESEQASQSAAESSGENRDPAADAPQELHVEMSPEARLERAEAEKAELEDRILRAQAEFMNYRRRTQNEMEQFRRYEGLHLVRDLLPVLDNLQRATQAAQQSDDLQNLKTGIDMVSRQLLEILQRNHIERIPAEGTAFDPNLHEAVQQAPSVEVPAMHVLAELETGYLMGDRIVRPAKVLVSTGPPPEVEES